MSNSRTFGRVTYLHRLQVDFAILRKADFKIFNSFQAFNNTVAGVWNIYHTAIVNIIKIVLLGDLFGGMNM